ELATGIEVVADVQVAGQVGGQTEAGKTQAVLADFDVDIHADRQGRIRLLRLLADDDGVFGYLHRGRRQLADGDVPARDLDPPAHRQPLIGQHQMQVRLDFQLGVRLDHYRQPRAGEVQIQVERLLPVQGAVQGIGR